MTTRTRKPPMSQAERAAVGILAAGMVVLGIYGFTTGAKSTFGYLVSVVVVGALVWQVRRRPLPNLLVLALAVDGVAHLAGGLVASGNDVLYNASIGGRIASMNTHILQYDHFVHAFGAFLATLTIWTLLAPPTDTAFDRRNVMVMCVLGGLGIGAVNEIIEFIATISHSAAHIGGYDNTGWDLVSNLIGAVAAIPFMHRIPVGAPSSVR